jgi:hypothetical protein
MSMATASMLSKIWPCQNQGKLGFEGQVELPLHHASAKLPLDLTE